MATNPKLVTYAPGGYPELAGGEKTYLTNEFRKIGQAIKSLDEVVSAAPGGRIASGNASGDFTTSSTTSVAITNLSLAFTTPTSGDILALFWLPSSFTVSGDIASFSFFLDGVAASNIIAASGGIATQTVAAAWIGTSLAPGAHTLSLHVHTNGNLVSILMSSVMNGTMLITAL